MTGAKVTGCGNCPLNEEGERCNHPDLKGKNVRIHVISEPTTSPEKCPLLKRGFMVKHVRAPGFWARAWAALCRLFHLHDYDWFPLPADELEVARTLHRMECKVIEREYRRTHPGSNKPAPCPPMPSGLEIRCHCGARR